MLKRHRKGAHLQSLSWLTVTPATSRSSASHWKIVKVRPNTDRISTAMTSTYARTGLIESLKSEAVQQGAIKFLRPALVHWPDLEVVVFTEVYERWKMAYNNEAISSMPLDCPASLQL